MMTKFHSRAFGVLLISLFLAHPSLGAKADYDREKWLSGWSAGDVRGDRLDTRQELLVERSVVPVVIECGMSLPRKLAASASQYVIAPSGPRRCRVMSGRWVDAYTGVEIVAKTPEEVAFFATIEHAIPLSDAHDSGGWCWPRSRKRAFANDKSILLIVSRGKNSSRNDNATFSPVHRPCAYAAIYMEGKARYGLLYDLEAASFYADQAERCSEVRR